MFLISFVGIVTVEVPSIFLPQDVPSPRRLFCGPRGLFPNLSGVIQTSERGLDCLSMVSFSISMSRMVCERRSFSSLRL